MIRLRSSSRPSKLAFVLAGALVATPVDGRAADGEADELRREVQRLRRQLDGLRGALSETIEQDRLRAAALGRALRAVGGDAPTPAAPASPPAPSAPAVPSPRSRPPGAAKPVVRRNAEPASEGATLRGRVALPPGEPVAFVYVENVQAPPVRGARVRIDQVRKQFVPPWAVVQRGTVVEFPNLDNIYHNVFSLSSGNSFDLGLYNSGGPAKAHVFKTPGAVDIYCNIHPQMAASVLVVPSRLFAKVRPDGTFEIPEVPAGRRKVVAWSPGSRLAVKWIEVPNGGAPAAMSFALERRAPGHRNKLGRPYGSYP